MSRDKQIEEMVFALTESQHEFDKAWKECLHNNAPMPDRENVFYAKYLIDKGYRKVEDIFEDIFEGRLEVVNKRSGDKLKKATDVAEEIFAEINSLRDEYSMGDIEYPDFLFRLGKIEKKYIGKDTNVPTNKEDK